MDGYETSNYHSLGPDLRYPQFKANDDICAHCGMDGYETSNYHSLGPDLRYPRLKAWIKTTRKH
jgi:hypothetical protein